MLSQASEYVKPLVPTFIGNCKLFEQLEDRKLAKINRKFSLKMRVDSDTGCQRVIRVCGGRVAGLSHEETGGNG